MNHDAFQTLLLNNGLGDTELVYTIAQGYDILLQGSTPFGICCELGQISLDVGKLAFLSGRKVKVKAIDAKGTIHLVATGLVAKPRDQLPILVNDGCATHFFCANLTLPIGDKALFSCIDCRRHIHFHQEMNAAAQIQAKKHRSGNLAQPLRTCGNQIQRRDEGAAIKRLCE